jgi:hypothetical protein
MFRVARQPAQLTGIQYLKDLKIKVAARYRHGRIVAAC